jgi:hypothetical protein
MSYTDTEEKKPYIDSLPNSGRRSIISPKEVLETTWFSSNVRINNK